MGATRGCVGSELSLLPVEFSSPETITPLQPTQCYTAAMQPQAAVQGLSGTGMSFDTPPAEPLLHNQLQQELTL